MIITYSSIRNGKYFQRQTFFSSKQSKIQPGVKSQDYFFFLSHTCFATIADHYMRLGSEMFNFKLTFILVTFISSANSYFIIQQNYHQGTESFISCNLFLNGPSTYLAMKNKEATFTDAHSFR